MPARAGKFPWSNIRDTTKSGKMRSSIRAGNYEWDLTEGWHPTRARGWKGLGKKTYVTKADGTRTPMVYKDKITLQDGTEATVFKTAGYDDYVGFHANDSMSDDTAAYIEAAFDDNAPYASSRIFKFGAGHIEFLEYAPKHKCLRVKFATNKAVCIYMGVPTAVAGQLLHLCGDTRGNAPTQVSTVDGRQRHVLGIKFWDLIRIRGQRHGSRYPFEYEQRGVYKLTGGRKRYTVTLSDENMKHVLGLRAFTSNAKAGDKVTAVLTEDEYAKYVEAVESMSGNNSLLNYGMGYDFSEGKDALPETIATVTEDFYKNHAVDNRKTFEETLSADELKEYNAIKNLYAERKKILEANHAEQRAAEAKQFYEMAQRAMYSNRTWAQEAVDRYNDWAEKHSQDRVDWVNKHGKNVKNFAGGGHTLEELASIDDPLSKNGLYNMFKRDVVMHHIDGPAARKYFDGRALRWGSFANHPAGIEEGQRRKGPEIGFDVKPDRKYSVSPREAFAGDTESYQKYVKWDNLRRMYDNKVRYAKTYTGMGWTKDKLKDYANATIKGNISLAHSDMYKKYINAGDYEGALNFLKNHKHEVSYSKDGKVQCVRIERYAEPHDFLID